MLFQKRRIRKAFEQRLVASAGLLRTCSELSAEAASLDLPDYSAVINVFQFAVLAYRDLDIVAYENFQPRHRQVHLLHWRLWVVLIYGYLEDFRHLLGKHFRDAMRAIGVDPTGLLTVGNVNSDMVGIFEREGERLKAIRNTVIAHRDDAQKQMAAIESLDLIWLSQLSREVRHHTETLYQALVPVLEQIAREIRTRRRSA